MTDRIVRNYTLDQRRSRDALFKCRSLADLKRWLDKHVVGEPVTTSDFRERTVDQRKNELRRRANEQFEQTMVDGFSDPKGVQWSTTGGARDKVLKLTQRIQEYRDGEVDSALPNGKTSVELLDANNQPQTVAPDKIKALAEKGDDHIDAAEDRLAQIDASIEASTSHSDLDAIDVTSGWL